MMKASLPGKLATSNRMWLGGRKRSNERWRRCIWSGILMIGCENGKIFVSSAASFSSWDCFRAPEWTMSFAIAQSAVCTVASARAFVVFQDFFNLAIPVIFNFNHQHWSDGCTSSPAISSFLMATYVISKVNSSYCQTSLISFQTRTSFQSCKDSLKRLMTIVGM